MRHKKGYKKLNKPTDQRIALLRSMTISLIEHGKIKGTDIRCKQTQRFIERLVTISKKPSSLSAVRQALKLLPNKKAVFALFEHSKRYADKQGGYTRITKLGFRRGDNAPISQLELV